MLISEACLELVSFLFISPTIVYKALKLKCKQIKMRMESANQQQTDDVDVLKNQSEIAIQTRVSLVSKITMTFVLFVT